MPRSSNLASNVSIGNNGSLTRAHTYIKDAYASFVIITVNAHPRIPTLSLFAEGEVMSASDAYRFPFVGSAALFSLYTAFKYLDPEWVNFLISFYFTFAGALAVASSFGPVVGSVLPSGVKKSYRYTIPHPLPPSVLDSPYTVEVSVHGVLSFVVGSIVGYFYFTSKHWTLNNVLGMCFCIQGISMFSIGSFKTASILLVGLFFYDVFWVFGTPVMVTVAKKLDGPIKLLFPRSLERNEEGKVRTKERMEARRQQHTEYHHN